MDTSASKFYLLLLLLSIFIFCSSGSFLSTANHFLHKELNKPLVQTTQHDTIITIDPPITTPTTTPLTNPVTTPSTGTLPPDFSTLPLVTVPSGNPTAPITFPPAIQNPVTPPIPITNPVTTPSTTTLGGQQPVTNPVTTYPPPTAGNDPTTTPVVVPPGTSATNAPTVPGQSWCVAKSGLTETAIQVALDYACGIGGADCSAIQQGASCYNPNSLQNHASYAFNSYYQRNPVQTSCDFGGAAMITNANPSSSSCIFTTGSSSSASPTPTTPMPTPTTVSPFTTTPTPTTESSSGATPSGSVTPPTVLNASSPALGGGITGESPPAANISAASSRPSSFQPFFGCIIVVTTIITGRAVLDI